MVQELYVLTRSIQHTKWNTAISIHIDISCEVPQSTILNPLLFSLYPNDFPLIPVYSSSIISADDSNLFITGKNIEILFNQMNHDLSFLGQWLIEKKLTLDLNKTHYIFFSRRKKPVCKNPNHCLKIVNSENERHKLKQSSSRSQLISILNGNFKPEPVICKTP